MVDWTLKLMKVGGWICKKKKKIGSLSHMWFKESKIQVKILVHAFASKYLIEICSLRPNLKDTSFSNYIGCVIALHWQVNADYTMFSSCLIYLLLNMKKNQILHSRCGWVIHVTLPSFSIKKKKKWIKLSKPQRCDLIVVARDSNS